jgi:hydrogenase maturation protease
VADTPDVAVQTLIIACGNPMRGDDGIGPIVADQVEALLPEHLQKNCRFIITHQLLPELALELAQTNRAILIDARVCDGEPVGVATVQAVTPEKCSGCGSQCCNTESGLTHHWTFPRLLAMADTLFGHVPEAYTVSVSAEDFANPDTLSPTIAAAIPQMCDHVMQLLSPE